MVTVTSRRAKPAPKEAARRADLATELLELYRKAKPGADRIEVIETELKAIATKAGDTFTETLAKLGTVKVAPAVDAEFKGNVPQIVTEKWLDLSKAEHNAFVKSGLIKIGRVTVKLFEDAA
jgi:hypothetical protein